MPKTTKTKPCEKCGEQMIAWPSNRKFCAACAIFRDMTYRPSRKTKCDACGDTFYPLRNNWTTCYMCSMFTPVEPEKYEPCQVCGECKRTAPGGAKTCVDCIQSSPDLRKRYFAFLKIRNKNIYSKPKEAA